MLKNIDFANIANVKVVDDILTDSIKMNASEIHFTRCDGGLRVDYIIDNQPVEYAVIPNDGKISASARNLIIRVKIIANLNIVEINEVQRGKIQANINGVNVNQTVIVNPTDKGEEMIITNL